MEELHPTVRWAARANSATSLAAVPPATLSDNELPSDYEEEDVGDSQLFSQNDSSGDETDAEEYLPSQATENNPLGSNDDDETDAEVDSDATDAEFTLDDEEPFPALPVSDGEEELPTQPVVEEPTIVIPDDSVILVEDEDNHASSEPVQNLPVSSNSPISQKKSPKKKSPLKASNLNRKFFVVFVNLSFSISETVDSELATCHICFENMKTDGAHEICALTSCGHLFGRECITKWIKMKKECPNCKKRTTKGQIKKIFPSSMPLVAEDSSEVENLRLRLIYKTSS